MACQKEDRDLIDHLVRVENRPCFGIRRRHDFRREIVGGMACGNRGRAGLGQLGDQRADLGGGAFGVL